MISTFPYYPKSYQPSGSGASGLASPKYSSGWSDMLGVGADPQQISPAQNAINTWGSNTTPYEGGEYENLLASFSPNIPTPAVQEPAQTESAAAEPTAEGAFWSWWNESGAGNSPTQQAFNQMYGGRISGGGSSPGALYNPNMDQQIMQMLPFGAPY